LMYEVRSNALKGIQYMGFDIHHETFKSPAQGQLKKKRSTGSPTRHGNPVNLGRSFIKEYMLLQKTPCNAVKVQKRGTYHLTVTTSTNSDHSDFDDCCLNWGRRTGRDLAGSTCSRHAHC